MTADRAPSDPGDLAGSAAPLADLVSYQAGAVVSRTILKRQTGSVTLFAFDAGESLSEHTVPFDALVVVLDGEAEITIAGEPSRLHQGDAIIMPGNRPHAVRADQRFKMMLTMIRA
jgi:quercetin dioxygenase-like cupin family protein